MIDVPDFDGQLADLKSSCEKDRAAVKDVQDKIGQVMSQYGSLIGRLKSLETEVEKTKVASAQIEKDSLSNITEQQDEIIKRMNGFQAEMDANGDIEGRLQSMKQLVEDSNDRMQKLETSTAGSIRKLQQSFERLFEGREAKISKNVQEAITDRLDDFNKSLGQEFKRLEQSVVSQIQNSEDKVHKLQEEMITERMQELEASLELDLKRVRESFKRQLEAMEKRIIFGFSTSLQRKSVEGASQAVVTEVEQNGIWSDESDDMLARSKLPANASSARAAEEAPHSSSMVRHLSQAVQSMITTRHT